MPKLSVELNGSPVGTLAYTNREALRNFIQEALGPRTKE